jgi:hypothetical protein
MDGAEGGHRRSIYVEILVRGALDDLWSLTQRPELHRRWDLRFSDIEYLPRPDESLPQRFLYTTRIGFGLAIRGWGESTGVREAGRLPGRGRSASSRCPRGSTTSGPRTSEVPADLLPVRYERRE